MLASGLWNDTTAITFTLRNDGSYEVTPSDFAAISYYIDSVRAAYTSDINRAFY